MALPASANPKTPRGYVLLAAMLVIGAVGTTIATSLVLMGVSSLQSGGAIADSVEAKALANACAERALQEIWLSASFAGTATLPLGNGSCTYTVTNTGGENRTISVSGTRGTVTRRATITVNEVTSSVGVNSWGEVAN